MQDYAVSFYKSQAWKKCRDAYAKSKGGLCENCLRKGIYAPGDIVHHKIHLTPLNIEHPEITLDWDNLQLLCRACHADIHAGREEGRRYRADELGRVTAL